MLRNILEVVISNIANYGVSFLVGFFLPVVLSVADYGYYKEYMLYMSYLYIFNLGYNDGIFKKYGGVSLSKVDETEFRFEHNFIQFFQLLVFIIMFIIGIAQENIILAFLSFSAYLVNMNTFHQNFLLAIGNYRVFSSGNILKSVLTVILLFISIFILKIDNFRVYILINIISLAFFYFYYEFFYRRHFGLSFKFNFDGKLILFTKGFLLLAANLMMGFVGNVGSFIVNNNYSIEQFAQYSFQASLLSVILLIANSISMVFYNLIAKSETNNLLKSFKKLGLLLGIIFGLAYFVFDFIFSAVLPEYGLAIEILKYTFVALPYIVVDRILISNLYKSKVTEKRYFIESLIFALSSTVFIYLVEISSHNLTSIAIATTISYIIWYFYSTGIKFNFLKSDFLEIVTLASHIIIFIFSTSLSNIIYGFIIFLAYVIILVLLNLETLKLFIRK